MSEATITETTITETTITETDITDTDTPDNHASDNEVPSPIKLSKLYPPKFSSIKEERIDRKNRLTATFRLFGKFGFDEGVAGHVTVRDPEFSDHFWVNPFGVSFKQMKVSGFCYSFAHSYEPASCHRGSTYSFSLWEGMVKSRPIAGPNYARLLRLLR